MKEDFGETRKLLYSLANRYTRKRQIVNYATKDINDIHFKDSEEIAERWREYCFDLLNESYCQDNFEKENYFRIGEEDNENPMTMEELEKAV